MQLELNRRSKVPMYRQLAAELREQIVSRRDGRGLPPASRTRAVLTSRSQSHHGVAGVSAAQGRRSYRLQSRQRHVRAAGCLRKPNIAHVKQ